MIKPKRYTLSLPENLHDELTAMAQNKGVSSKEIFIKCLKLGLIAFDADNTQNELILREKKENGTETETRLILI